MTRGNAFAFGAFEAAFAVHHTDRPIFCMEVAPVTGFATSDPLARCAELSRKPVELAVALSTKSGNFDITSLHVQMDVIVAL